MRENTLIMDNHAIQVTGGWREDGCDDLTPVLQMALNHHASCVGWTVSDRKLLLWWFNNGKSGITPVISPITTAAALHSLVTAWLLALPIKREIPDRDAIEEPGAFEAWTDQWGQGDGIPYAMLAIKPRTRWLGK